MRHVLILSLVLLPALAHADPPAAVPAPVLTLPVPPVEVVAPAPAVPLVPTVETAPVCVEVPIFNARARRIVTIVSTVAGIVSGIGVTSATLYLQGRQAGVW